MILGQVQSNPPMPGPSITVLLVLIAALAASVWVYARLTHLWTARRPLAALQEWARANGFREVPPASAQLPAALMQMDESWHVERVLQGEQTTILQVRGAGGPLHVMARELMIGEATATTPAWPATGLQMKGAGGPLHVMARELMIGEATATTPAWPATGLRPADRAVRWMDARTRRSFPTLLPPDRFVVVGTERAPAEALAASSVKALLPRDVAMMAVGHTVLLEFSTRPFDGVEFSRLLAVMQQVTAALPPLVFHGDDAPV